jgi:hypothetical protein
MAESFSLENDSLLALAKSTSLDYICDDKYAFYDLRYESTIVTNGLGFIGSCFGGTNAV